MKLESLALLKNELERVFGRKILTSSDCNALSKDIFETTQLKIGLNTLRRFFNLMKSEYQPSLFTLDLLSKYCNYTSFSDFIVSKENEKEVINNTERDRGLLNFLILLFKDNDIKEINDTTYIHFIHEILINIEQWPGIIDQFQRHVAKTVNGQVFYFELFVNIDKLNSYYGKGLFYYLKEKKTAEAQIFGHSLLCLKNWLTIDADGLKFHYIEVMNHKLDEKIHPFVCGRYFATQLYYAEANNLEVDSILTKARDFQKRNKNNNHVLYKNFPCFEFILTEALTLTKQYEEALFYINEVLKKRPNNVQPHINPKLFESIYLFQAIALASLGKVEKSKLIIKNIRVENFYFLAKNFNTILYLLYTKMYLKKKVLQKQLKYLIAKTGFKKLIQNQAELI
jgi:hypothetical protein